MTGAQGPIVVLGGTFDPPHIGHLILAECVRAQFGAALVVFLPAGDPWRKSGSVAGPPRLTNRMITNPHLRLEMVRLAVADNPAFIADDREVRRAGPSYTVETLEELRREGYAPIILPLGADALGDLPNWKEPERIRHLAKIVAAPKAGAPLPEAARSLPVADMPLIEVSSTEIRARVAEGKPIRYLVPAGVEAFIRERGLYRAGD